MFKKLLWEHFDILSSILWKYWLLKKKKVWTFYKISPDSFFYKVMIFWKYCDILVMFLFMKVSWENYVTVVCKKVKMAVFQNIAFVTLQIIITRIYHSKKKKKLFPGFENKFWFMFVMICKQFDESRKMKCFIWLCIVFLGEEDGSCWAGSCNC